MNAAATGPKAVIYRLLNAMNQLNLEEMLDCIDEDYVSEGMLPTEWWLQGRNQVRENWTDLPHRTRFRAEIHGCMCEGDEVWAEWRMFTPHPDGSVSEVRGVIINTVRNDLIVRGR